MAAVTPTVAPGTSPPVSLNVTLAGKTECQKDRTTRPPPGIPNYLYPWVVGKNTSFSLDEHCSAFIEGEVAAGRYRSVSDVVRSALRLLEDREAQLRALREALVVGERSGTSTPFDFDAFLGRKRAEESRGR